MRGEIKKYSEQITELTKELKELTVKETEEKKEKNKVKKIKNPRRNSTTIKTGLVFSEGDRVVIRNRYKRKKDTKGKVTKIIGNFTFLDDKYGAVHQ